MPSTRSKRQFDVICTVSRVAQYKLLRIERDLYNLTSEQLRNWVSSDVNPETSKLYYTTLGQLSSANNRSLTRMNEIRKRLGLPPHVDETTQQVQPPLDED